jgi:hypothetical protein
VLIKYYFQCRREEIGLNEDIAFATSYAMAYKLQHSKRSLYWVMKDKSYKLVVHYIFNQKNLEVWCIGHRLSIYM